MTAAGLFMFLIAIVGVIGTAGTIIFAMYMIQENKYHSSEGICFGTMFWVAIAAGIFSLTTWQSIDIAIDTFEHHQAIESQEMNIKMEEAKAKNAIKLLEAKIEVQSNTIGSLEDDLSMCSDERATCNKKVSKINNILNSGEVK